MNHLRSNYSVAVRIRMKKMGRTHRPYFRICAIDKRSPRDGRALEELGHYDPMIADVDARCVLKSDRIEHWLSVGAQPSEKCAVLIKKYGKDGTHLDAQRAALEKLAMGKEVPDVGEPASMPKEPEAENPAEEAKAEETKAEGGDVKSDDAKAEELKGEEAKTDDLAKQGETAEAKVEKEENTEADTVPQEAAEKAAEAEVIEDKPEEKPAEA